MALMGHVLGAVLLAEYIQVLRILSAAEQAIHEAFGILELPRFRLNVDSHVAILLSVLAQAKHRQRGSSTGEARPWSTSPLPWEPAHCGLRLVVPVMSLNRPRSAPEGKILDDNGCGSPAARSALPKPRLHLSRSC